MVSGYSTDTTNCIIRSCTSVDGNESVLVYTRASQGKNGHTLRKLVEVSIVLYRQVPTVFARMSYQLVITLAISSALTAINGLQGFLSDLYKEVPGSNCCLLEMIFALQVLVELVINC